MPDVPGNTSSTYTLAVGGSVGPGFNTSSTTYIENFFFGSDHDYWRIYLTPGTYQFNVDGDPFNQGSGVYSIDSVLTFRNSSDVSLGSNNGGGFDSQVTQTVTAAGYYYLDVSASTSNDVGYYVLSATNLNQTPVANNDSYAVNEDGSLVVGVAGVLGNDTDGDPNPLTAVLNSGPSHGSLTLNADGSFTYTPDANYNGPDSFTYHANDGSGYASQNSNVATVNITVNSVNDEPVGLDLDGYTSEDVPLPFNSTFVSVAFSDPIDGNGFGGMIVTTLPTAGTLTLNGGAVSAGQTISAADILAGNLVFTPDADASGSPYATMTFQVIDDGGTANGGQDTDQTPNTITFHVAPVDDPAVALDDKFVTIDTASVAGNLFADNGFGADYDIDGPALAIGEVDAQPGLVGMDYVLASGGTVHVNADGTFTYTPGGAAAQLAAPGSGATNTQLAENFDYTLVGGGTGNVTIVVQGTDGYDTLLGTKNADNLHGGLYDDVLIGGLGADMLDGGAGNDTASYAGDPAGVFANLSTGQGYANSSFGDTYTSIENLIGTDFNDFLIGDPGVNVLDGGAGNDTIIGGLGPDVLIGGAGIDTLSYEDNSGTVFVNLLTGMGFNNAAQGDTYSGFENVIGGLFDDTIIGDNGANRLDGAMGADTLVGNGGADTFVFSYAPGATSPWGSPNVDTIFDFVSGEDKLEINAAAFGGGLTPGGLAAGAFVIGTGATDADDRFIYDQASGNLYFDADGSGGGAQVLMAILPNHDVIAATDFVIV